MKSEDKIRIWRDQPDVFVREVFGVTPDPWQDEVLKAFPHKQRIALLASKGVGKTTVEAWLAWNFLLTRPHPKIAATSISGDNLRDGLWTEMAYWQAKSPLLKNMFVWQKERIFAKDHPETWWMSARQWKKDADANAIGNTLAGLHADYIMFVLDESGDMPPAILASAEAALSSCKEGHVLQAGNPVSHEGALYAASVSDSIWHLVKINSDPDNPNRSPRVSKQWAQDQIKQFGRDNPWVLVNVFGQFPPSSFNSLIGPEEVAQAINKRYKESDYIMSPVIFGIDCARYGDDCLRDDTEVLTYDGWKFFPDLVETDKVLSTPQNENKSRWMPIDEIVSYDFDGELNEYETRALNFSVTDNHRFLVKSNPKSTTYKFEKFKDLAKFFVVREENGFKGAIGVLDTVSFNSSRIMPNGGLHTKNWSFNFKDWCDFLGWFVSEGNVYTEKRKNGRKRILVAQNPGPKQELIKACLTKLDIKFRVTPNQKQLEFSNNEIGKWLIDNCGHGASNKRIPQIVKNGSEEIIKTFLNSFRLGDGTRRKDGKGAQYYTSSKRLADDLQELLFKIGRSGSLRLKYRAGSEFSIGDRKVIRKHDTYVIYERDSSKGKYVNKDNVKRVPYKGKIWCLRTEYQSFVIRRKGVPMWSGNSSVLFVRQGLRAFDPFQFRNLDGTQGAEITARKWDQLEADACFIDDSGGFGSSWIDNLIRVGKDPIGIHFSKKASSDKYFNKRTEMAFECVEWIKRGGWIPNIPELTKALVSTSYGFKGEQLLLEPKEDVKSRLQFSPDHMDALMLTFAMPVDKDIRLPFNNTNKHQVDYNPFSREKYTDNANQYVYDPRR